MTDVQDLLKEARRFTSSYAAERDDDSSAYVLVKWGAHLVSRLADALKRLQAETAPGQEALSILQRMSDEYDADEECSYPTLHGLIEDGQKLLRHPDRVRPAETAPTDLEERIGNAITRERLNLPLKASALTIETLIAALSEIRRLRAPTPAGGVTEADVERAARAHSPRGWKTYDGFMALHEDSIKREQLGSGMYAWKLAELDAMRAAIIALGSGGKDHG